MPGIILTQPSSASSAANYFDNQGNLNTVTDAFGRVRVSELFTLFDNSMRYYDDPYKFDTELTGGGSSIQFLPNEASLALSVTGNGDRVLRESKTVFSYQPGKSLLILNTFVMNPPTVGLTQRCGYYGANNGIYFELNGLDVNIVKRTYISGTIQEIRVSQANWNVDKLDGTGPSKITLDPSKAQIFWTDVEWLGVGSIRTGFVINGQYIITHIFHHANLLDTVYMTTATLPIRYELISTGATGTLKQICSTVMSEGGYTNRSRTRAASSPLIGTVLSNAVYRPLISIRLASSRLDAIVVPQKVDLFGLQQAAYKYQIVLNSTLANSNFTSVGANSSVEYDVSATGMSGGLVLDEGIFVGSNKGGTVSVTQQAVDFTQQLGRFINGTSDVFTIAALATTNNDTAVGTVTWQEHT